ncbi:amino acid ABC transporter permease [Paraburkholderia tropica]|uniref:amino acid ABC transporter permease n=1 Tax=Paraburkholderia tropica TaxID=92647 RepID=UPI0007EC70C3|nr:amino acid ABC transporter permease [Paraburkholderia tropica]MBB2981938.1 polar amino acid transport system permease protein [Paraburkholderia tropica]OBR51162.1 ABC transporter permease [Paraburkholderia tropica]
MNTFIPLIPRFAAAMLVTLEVSLTGALFGMAGGFLLNALRLRFARTLAWPYRLYVWLVRGTPYLSQLLILYFGLPALGVTMTAVQATVVSLALYSAAYFAEIFRAGWASIARGQLEAVRAFGIGRWAAFRTIELPQAMTFALPLLTNQVILVIKESAVASIITVPELTMTTSDIVASTYTYIGPYALLILCYWLLTQSVAVLAQRAALLFAHSRRTS